MRKSILGWSIWLSVLAVMYLISKSYLHTRHLLYFSIIFLFLCVSVLIGFQALHKLSE
jgi:hypothetical protein